MGKDASAALDAAIQAAGGANALARALGRTPGVVSQWRRLGRVPAELAGAVADLTGVSRSALRPDLFATPGLAEAQAPFQEAATLGLDADRIAADALRRAVAAEKARRWAEENRAALAAHTAWIEEHDTPLAQHRMF